MDNMFPHLRTLIQSHPHYITFSSTNITCVNICKAWFGCSVSSSDSMSWINQCVGTNTPLTDTYTLYWTYELNEFVQNDVPVGTPVCRVELTLDRCIIDLYTDERVRGIGLATYLMTYIKNIYWDVYTFTQFMKDKSTLFETCGIDAY